MLRPGAATRRVHFKAFDDETLVVTSTNNAERTGPITVSVVVLHRMPNTVSFVHLEKKSERKSFCFKQRVWVFRPSWDFSSLDLDDAARLTLSSSESVGTLRARVHVAFSPTLAQIKRTVKAKVF